MKNLILNIQWVIDYFEKILKIGKSLNIEELIENIENLKCTWIK